MTRVLLVALVHLACLVAGAFASAQAGSCTSEWVPVFQGGPGLEGAAPAVFALEVFDDGVAPALYVGGSFTGIAGIAANNIARFDGQSWVPLGGGVDGWVRDLCVYDDGTGPALYVAGQFTVAGGTAMPLIAKWDGSTWSSVGAIDPDWLYLESLAVGDLGSGPRLFAGEFTTGITAGVAMWDGNVWEKIGGFTSPAGTKAFVGDLAVFDDGSGSALYAVGSFSEVNPGGASATNAARWDGLQWSPISGGLNGSAQALAMFDDGTGPALYAAGIFTQAGV